MLTVADAVDRVLRTIAPLPVRELPLDECWGLHLAADVVSDLDSPPFDKALMDGYAARTTDVASGKATLAVVEHITAGRSPQRQLAPGEATQIMTGAPLPAGADAVVRIEDTHLEGNTVTIRTGAVTAGQNIARRGTALRVGERVLAAGQPLTASRIAVLAELGRARLLVLPRPRIAVLATGDELVPVAQTPGPGQIRNSNEPMLVAQIRAAGGTPIPLGIARDTREHLSGKIQQGLQADVLVLSGGVSAGKLDLVPSELAAAGVHEVFHKVDMKPGKPVWFGAWNRPGGGPPCAVFGLPGNPVSSMVCFELFVRTALRRLMGTEPAAPQPFAARMHSPFVARNDRPTYHPADVSWTAAGWEARMVNWHGSFDLRATVDANGMVFFPPGERHYHAGDVVEAYTWA